MEQKMKNMEQKDKMKNMEQKDKKTRENLRQNQGNFSYIGI